MQINEQLVAWVHSKLTGRCVVTVLSSPFYRSGVPDVPFADASRSRKSQLPIDRSLISLSETLYDTPDTYCTRFEQTTRHCARCISMRDEGYQRAGGFAPAISRRQLHAARADAKTANSNINDCYGEYYSNTSIAPRNDSPDTRCACKTRRNDNILMARVGLRTRDATRADC